MKSAKRKKLLIHRGIQGTLLFHFAFHWVIFSALTAILIVFLQCLYTLGLDAEVRNQQLRMTLLTLIVVSVVLTPAFAFDLLRLSHRFVGPVYRMKRYFQQTNSTDNVPLTLRQDDYWQDVAQVVNEMFARLRTNEDKLSGNKDDASESSNELQKQ